MYHWRRDSHPTGCPNRVLFPDVKGSWCSITFVFPNKNSHSARVSNVRHSSKTRVEALDKPACWRLLHFPATCIHSTTSSTGGTSFSRLARESLLVGMDLITMAHGQLSSCLKV